MVRLTGREELSVADVRTSHREAWTLESDEEDNIPYGEIPLLRDRRLQPTRKRHPARTQSARLTRAGETALRRLVVSPALEDQLWTPPPCTT